MTKTKDCRIQTYLLCRLPVKNPQFGKHLLDILGLVELPYFPMASRSYGQGPFDIGLVEGAVTTPEEIEAVQQIRKEVKTLVALGTCACYGGIPSIKNRKSQRELTEKSLPESLSHPFHQSLRHRRIREGRCLSQRLSHQQG